MKNKFSENKIANIHKVLASPFRIRLLLTLGRGEACVCHLETVLKKRQAYISQHLMVMRDSGILGTRRKGKYIYYRVLHDEVFDLLAASAAISGLEPDGLIFSAAQQYSGCECPNCS